MEDCIIDKANLGFSKCSKLPELIKCMITTPDGFSFTDANAIDPTFWQTALLASQDVRIYLWPNFVAFADQSVAAVYQDGPLAYLPVRDGNYRFKFNISKDMCTHRKMFTHREVGSGRVLLWDTANQVTATRGSDGLLRGLQMQLLWTEKLDFNDGSKRTSSPILVALEDNKEIDANGVIFDAPFLNTILRLTDVELAVLTVPTPLATGFNVSVTTECDGTPITGLLMADFIVTDANGTNHAITSVTPVAGQPGVYRIAGAGFVDGTVTLRAANLLTVKAYEASPAILDL